MKLIQIHITQLIKKLKGRLNIRSLVKNIDLLRVYLSKQKYNMISINEKMLDCLVSNDEININ